MKMKWVIGVLVFSLLSCGVKVSRQDADELYENNKYREAAYRYEKLYKKRPTQSLAMKLANSYVNSKEYIKAESLIREFMVSQEEELDEYAFEYANILRQNGKLKEALNWYQKSESNDTSVSTEVHKLLTTTMIKQEVSCYGNTQSLYCVDLDASESVDQERDDLIFEWEFDDGQSAKGIMVNHCFAKSGDHQVILNVFDPVTGYTDKKEVDLSVSFEPPFGVDYAGNIYTGEEVVLNIKGELPPTTEKVVWDLGDTKVKSGESIKHTYFGAGSHTIKVLVFNSKNELETCYEKKLAVYVRR